MVVSLPTVVATSDLSLSERHPTASLQNIQTTSSCPRPIIPSTVVVDASSTLQLSSQHHNPYRFRHSIILLQLSSQHHFSSTSDASQFVVPLMSLRPASRRKYYPNSTCSTPMYLCIIIYNLHSRQSRRSFGLILHHPFCQRHVWLSNACVLEPSVIPPSQTTLIVRWTAGHRFFKLSAIFNPVEIHRRISTSCPSKL